MSTEILLKVTGLTKQFPGVRALDNVDFELSSGSVHAVCGENGAGKSTLMNILMGVYQKDSGSICINGKEVNFLTPRQALNAGIAIIEQELNPIPEMTVAENMLLGREETSFRVWLDYRRMEEKASKLLAGLGADIDPHLRMKNLSLAQVQIVEIAKAISYDSDIIIMDEPTSAIGEKDVETLFRIINVLKSEGKGIIYVSHRMKEIFTISDTVTVLRDGGYIGTRATGEITRSDLVNMMIGRKLEEEYIKTNTPKDEPALEIHNLSKKGCFHDISLKLNRGEILGIFGLMGSGRSEFFDALFGVGPAESGAITVFGKEKRHREPGDAIKSGLALVTEDRKLSGLVLTGSVRENVSLPNLKKLSNGIFINHQKETSEIQKITDRFQLKSTGLDQKVSRLSGGNQQKVVLSKWLLTEPKILLLDEPTRGIDVGAKRELYAFMSRYAEQGNAVMMISSELPEVLGMSDRIVVFRNGRLVGERRRDTVTQSELMFMASEGGAQEEMEGV